MWFSFPAGDWIRFEALFLALHSQAEASKVCLKSGKIGRREKLSKGTMERTKTSIHPEGQPE